MENYEDQLKEEMEYFNRTMYEIQLQLSKNLIKCGESKDDVISFRKEMWEDMGHSAGDKDKLGELAQYLQNLNMKTSSYFSEVEEIEKLKRLQDSAYFARIDFKEEGYEEVEKIYIGKYTLINDKHEILVYDWRSPIASIFYRFELGDVHYEAPVGKIFGEVLLKRQYEIIRGKFEYFFDANIQIVDEYLRKLLSQNASTKMTNIVETIQRDQDMIIRDEKNELLMVQGVAGSGKTSVALHRIAYLMYQEGVSNLSHDNIVIISPNPLFGKYISNVLPELGEENVDALGFEDIFYDIIGDKKLIQSRNEFFEQLFACDSTLEKNLIKSSMEFKGSNTFITMLKSLIHHYEYNLISFGDIYYNNQYLFHRHSLKNRFLQRSKYISTYTGLKQIENMILEEIREEKNSRIISLEKFISKYPEHMFEIKEYARMLSIKENAKLVYQIHSFTTIDYYKLYYEMFSNKNLFYTLAQGLKLPENIEEIRCYTVENLQREKLKYEDALALTFLKIKIGDNTISKDIKQVVIDEAQDYYPIHFEILNLLFPRTKYTILADINQTIEKHTTVSFYKEIQRIFYKKTARLLTMSKSFRSTEEIIEFSSKFIDESIKIESYSRSGVPPEIVFKNTRHFLDEKLIELIEDNKKEGYQSIAVLCKSLKDAKTLYARIKDNIDIQLIDDTYGDIIGSFIIPIYMAKGLEFDAVIIYDVDNKHYYSKEDKKLLYIASTRALHRLLLLYTGEISIFLEGGDHHGTK